ncbi:MAG: cation-transporting P-type ATPase [Zwartia sp.]
MPIPRTDESQVAWHALSTEEIFRHLSSSQDGLTEANAQERLSKYGPNRLPETARKSWLNRFILHFHNILIYVLIGSAAITGFLKHWVDTGVILAVVIANALIGFIQEGKAEHAMNAIRHMLAPHANVIRNGERTSIQGDNLVPGDIVLIEAGDKIAADLRLITTHGLSVQEAILTGESVPVEKHTVMVTDQAPLGDRKCMAFSGTLVASGQGKGIVVATGAHTEIGHISHLLSNVETLTTPLVSQIAMFAKWLSIFILLVAFLLITYGYFVGHHSFSEMFMAVVGLSVAAIPEGLPAVLSITLAVGVQAMARRNAIVRRLPAIETLGSVSVICTDKTGTLTRNEMMVACVVTLKQKFIIEGDGYAPVGLVRQGDQSLSTISSQTLLELGSAAYVCNDAVLRQQEGVWLVEGDPMEGALLAFAGKVNAKLRNKVNDWVRIDAIAFDAKHRFMATLNHGKNGEACIFVKGAPERILTMCNHQRKSDGQNEPLDIFYWTHQAEVIAEQGQRVLAFAVRSVTQKMTSLSHYDVEGSLTLLGIVGMIDPPRPEAISAVQECHGAGIRVKMITGDHAKTAVAIGKKIGLINHHSVLTGVDLDRMNEGELRQAVLDCDIFARTSPEHKLRLVMALQSQDLTVAMTGDGVNDAPALKRADAGIAMGKKGSEAAKEAAELVLADDNFASIVAAIREGRTVYDNIRKVISWTLPTNAGEAATIMVALLFGLTLPITPIQILWINLITGITLGLALAFEPTEDGTMKRAPRMRQEGLLTGALVWHIILVSILFLSGVYGIFTYAVDRGYSVELARTLAVNTLVVMEIFHLFFIRNFYSTSLTWKAVRGTKVTWIVVTAVVLAQLAITYVPILQNVFATEAIGLGDGILVIAIGIALFAIVETEKQIRLHLLTLKYTLAEK